MSVETQLERTTSRIRFLVTDIDGVTGLLNLTSLTSLKLKLFEKSTQTVINSRDWQDIKNANGFVVYDTVQTDPITSEPYNVLGRLDPADNLMVTTNRSETHVASFEWTWGSPLRTGRGVVEIPIRNLTFVPSS